MRWIRAANLAAATALLSLLLIAALTARYRIAPETRPASVVIVSAAAPPRPAPPEPREPSPSVGPSGETAAAPVAPPPPTTPGPAQPAEPPMITEPHWLERPTHPERFYPRQAFVRGVEGRVELTCFVETDGRLSCEVASETPEGQGFADAALALARAHVMQPAMENGAPVRARYRMVVPFSTR